jgi:predicted transcriptional regulator
MATVGERLTKVEAAADETRRRLDELHDLIHGGPSVMWAQSIRGRLHHMQSAIEAADKLADAARDLARQQEANRRSRLTRMQWAYIALCSTAAAAAPYVILLTH